MEVCNGVTDSARQVVGRRCSRKMGRRDRVVKGSGCRCSRKRGVWNWVSRARTHVRRLRQRVVQGVGRTCGRVLCLKRVQQVYWYDGSVERGVRKARFEVDEVVSFLHPTQSDVGDSR